MVFRLQRRGPWKELSRPFSRPELSLPAIPSHPPACAYAATRASPDVSLSVLATIWRALVVTALPSGSALLAITDLSGFPLSGFDDRHLHFAAFFGATLLAVSAFPRAPLTHVLLALGFLAGITELLQFLPGVNREPDWGDFAFDILGVDCALIAVAVLRALFRQAPAAPTTLRAA